ncbi:MAG: restriction endonuclease subunit S [Porphyromonas sp.]|nr:restriction endonuclease subunit S [Porphyromonas sp.]
MNSNKDILKGSKTSQSTRNCPALRFPEFEGEWQEIPNKQLFSITNERNSNLQRGLVLSASQTLGMISREQIGIEIKYKEESLSTYKLVNKGDYVVHLRSFQGGFAFSEVDGICSPAYTILRPTSSLYYGFFKDYFRSTSFITSLIRVTYGIRDGRSISVDEWMTEKTILPSLAEQRKIAEFLSLIDDRLEVSAKIIKELKTQKAGLQDAIFKQRLRFPGFSDPWTQTTLGEVLVCHSSNLTERDIQSDGSIPILGASGYVGYTEVDSPLTESILIIKDGSGVGRVQYIKEEHYFLATLNSLGSKSEIVHQKFIYYFLSQFDFRQYVSGSGIPHIYFKDYSKASIPLPSLEEQKKIAELFTIFDERIEVEEALLKCYETQKRYLLRQMFV